MDQVADDLLDAALRADDPRRRLGNIHPQADALGSRRGAEQIDGCPDRGRDINGLALDAQPAAREVSSRSSINPSSSPSDHSIKSRASRCFGESFTFAQDGSGNLTPLAKKYKRLFDGGYLDSFSVGMIVNEHAPLRETGGFDIKSSELYEISAVTIPANAHANTLKALKDELGEMLDEPKAAPNLWVRYEKDGSAWVSKEAHALTVKTITHNFMGREFVRAVPEPHVEPSLTEEKVKGLLATHLAPLADLTALLKGMVERLDALESAVTVLANTVARGEDERKHAELSKGLKEIDAAAAALLKTMRP